MPFFQLRNCVPHPCANCFLENNLWPLFSVLQNMHFQRKALQLIHLHSVAKEASLSYSTAHPLTVQPVRFSQSTIYSEETSEILGSYESEILINLTENQNFIGGDQRDRLFNSNGCLSDQEMERRRKIGLANKGKVPWNKGKKHSEETRLLIKQRTIEALKDPKVRKKKSEHPRILSDQTKERIRNSLKRIWNQRSKWKQLQEQFFLLWSRSIAEAAKKGGINQEELDWDSYDKLKQEIALEQLQWAKEKSRAKDMARLRVERSVIKKAEKLAMLAQKKKEREEELRLKRELKKKLKMEKKNNKESEDLKLRLKRRLTKICKMKPANRQVTIKNDGAISSMPPLEQLDIELIKRERMKKEVSLAEQIKEAKSRSRIHTC